MLKAGLLTRSVFCLAFPNCISISVALVFRRPQHYWREIELTAAGTVSDFHGIPILIRHIRYGWSGTKSGANVSYILYRSQYVICISVMNGFHLSSTCVIPFFRPSRHEECAVLWFGCR